MFDQRQLLNFLVFIIFVLDLELTYCPTAICHSFRLVYEHGRWHSVYEYDC